MANTRVGACTLGRIALPSNSAMTSQCRAATSAVSESRIVLENQRCRSVGPVGKAAEEMPLLAIGQSARTAFMIRTKIGESEVRIRLADNGIARILPDADRRFLDSLVSEVLDRKVRVHDIIKARNVTGRKFLDRWSHGGRTRSRAVRTGRAAHK